MTATTDLDADERLPELRGVVWTAAIVILCFVGAALGWGMFARLDAAVTTRGVLFVESKRKTVEHLEGGILETLLVKPGQHVEEGEVVARLDSTQIREQIRQLEVERWSLAFDIWRLEAEQAGAAALDPARAPDAPADLAADFRVAQERRFEARLRAHRGEIEALTRQIDQLSAQIAADAGQAAAAERQLTLWREERELNDRLVKTGATPRQKLLEFDRTIAGLEGMRDEHRNLVRAAEEQIASARAQIETLEQRRLADVGGELAEARRGVEAAISRIRAAEDVLRRHDLRAPQAGTVVDITTVTPGAVVGSGAPLMEIVPDGDRIVALAELPPDAIDTVHPGRKARVRMIAYKRATAPVVDGEVIYVSADLLQNERDGESYYEARVALDPADLAAHPEVTLTPGMPVEIAIQIGERRAGDYILEPLLRHVRNAFHEE